MSNTNTTFPINFELYDENEESVLFSTDNALGQTMTLDITNQSGQPIVIKKLGKKVSEQHHHFEFVFRPSTLFNSPSTITLQSSNFKMHVTKNNQQIVPNSDGSHSLYIAYTGTSQLKMNSTEKITLQLAQMRADAEGGTRGTRVMVKYQNLFHVGATNSFSGFRETKLNLVNHRGKRNIPLQVGFIGANTVLNDGNHANGLKLRVTNVSRKKVAIDNTAELSKLVLVAEGGPASEEWTLATDTELGGQNGMKVNVTYPNGQTTPATTDLGVNVWEFPFSRLEPGQYIDIALTNLITNHLTGHAKLYLHYENIPGYWDGQFVAIVEKTPLVFKNKHVGIGTANPVAAVQINHQNQNADGNTLILGPTTQSHLRLGYDANYSWIQSHGRKPLAVNPLGNNVGIGTTDPKEMLEVNGNIQLAGRGRDIQFIREAGDQVGVLKSTIGAVSYTGMQIGFPSKVVGGNLTVGSWSNAEEPVFKEVMRVNHDGKVTTTPDENQGGIDILSPSAGNTHLPHVNNWHYLSGEGAIFRHFANGQYAEKMRIDYRNGNVSIGALDTPAKLKVQTGNNERGVEIWSPTAGNTHFPWTDNWNYISGNGVIFRNGANQERMRMDLKTGRIGIAANTTKAMLEIGRYVGYNYTHLGGIGTASGRYSTIRGGTGVWGTSIWTDGKMAAHAYTVQSDKRIKLIDGKSNGKSDLLTLLDIEVTDFRYKDFVAKGDASHKKLIAQQVASIYPQAVSLHTDVVPDIYQNAPLKNGWITMTADLKKGDKVKLISDSTSEVVEVLEVSDVGFRTDFKPESDTVFVYGREVDDFSVVDYNAIAMLNVSATQEIYKQIDGLKKENTAFKDALAQIESELITLKNQFVKQI
jgi:hypothetical protein